MAEYIEREALMEILNGLYEHHLMMCNYAADGATQDCIEAVINAPTADVVEVRHGYWVHHSTDDNDMVILQCSVCGVSNMAILTTAPTAVQRWTERVIDMFNTKDILFWLGNVAVVDDYNGGYWLVDWSNSGKRMHVGKGEGE